MLKLGIIRPYQSNYIKSMLIVSKTKKPFVRFRFNEQLLGNRFIKKKSKQYNAFIILNRVMEFNVTNLKGIRSFLDFINFYARFVNNYAKSSITWLKLIRKHVRFKWQKI